MKIKTLLDILERRDYYNLMLRKLYEKIPQIESQLNIESEEYKKFIQLQKEYHNWLEQDSE